MPFYVYLAATGIAAAVPLLVWSLTAAGGAKTRALATLGQGGDLRQAVLAQSAQERAVAPLLRAVAARARRLTPVGWVDKLERQLDFAGRPPAWPLERVFAAKVLLGVVGLLGGLALLPGGLFMTIGYTVGFYWIPDLLLRSRARTRQDLIALELPDTIDQITIAVEAGLGFENALARAARSGSGPLAGEFIRTLQEIQVGVSRANALRGLAARTDAPDLRQFVSAILQAEQYGVPTVDVLRIQSAEMRRKRGQRAEERAMKIPVKIVFPLVLCILPVLFIIVLGPAGISLARILGNQ